MTIHRFTDKWVQSCKAASDRDDYADGLCPGLHLRVTRKGTKTFSAMIRVDRRLRRQTLGRYPRLSLAEARQATLQLMRKAAANSDLPRAAGTMPQITFAELVTEYVDKHLKPNARTWKFIAASLRHRALASLQARRAASITKTELIAILDERAKATPQAAVNMLRNLKMVFNWAVDRDMVPASPCDRIRPPAKTNERDRVLTDDEIVAVWKATFRMADPIGQMFRLFMLTGQRRAEVSTLRWKEIDGDLWVIPREKVKKDRTHAVPLTATALATLASVPRFGDESFVFSTTGGARPYQGFTKGHRALKNLSGTSGWTIHDIRRTVRSKLAELGVPREVARKVLNHEDGKVDRIYNRHEYLAEKREALAKWERHLLTLR